MREEIYVFKCNECGHIYAEVYDSHENDDYPQCSDCGSEDVEIYEGEISPELQRAIDEYNEENGIEE